MLLAVPVTVASMAMTARGSVRALVVWLGALAYLAYNSVMFVFATPFNRLFLVYVAMLSLSVWTLVSLLPRTDPSSIVTERIFARTIAVYIWVVVALNTLAWMRVVVPALFADRPGRFLDGSGLPTSPAFVQDLAVWLQAMTLAALWLWRGQPRGVLLAGAGLVFWCVEAVGIAVDQWFGSRADPSSDVASMSVVPVFATLAAVGVVPIWLHLRAVRGRTEPD